MDKSPFDFIVKNAWKVGLLPLSGLIASIEVAGDLAAGKAPKAKDVLKASGLLDSDDPDVDVSDCDTEKE